MSAMADVCLILEGTYPYVTGGVSVWTHDLIRAQSHLTFHLVTLLAPGADRTLRFELPPNVIGRSDVVLQELPSGTGRVTAAVEKTIAGLEEPFVRLFTGGGLAEIGEINRALSGHRSLGRQLLLNSEPAWALLQRLYRRLQPDSPFLEFFWGWRTLAGGLFSMLLCDLPPARVYHPVCTGYAGLLAARAHLETGRPVLLTEHGIYTNERRIEIGMADWLEETMPVELTIEKARSDVKDLWIGTFVSYSRACYEAAYRVITLYAGNQSLQLMDGATPESLRVIPNGIDCRLFDGVTRETDHPPTVALIGRVVPIKDIKTFVRACGLLRRVVPDLRAYVLGPTDEDTDYFEQCRTIVEHLELEETITFTGRVNLREWLGRIDVVALTSISEAQPLVILEAAAFCIPVVATDVGACREMIEGAVGENPAIGAAGIVIPLSNPVAAAEAMARLLGDSDFYTLCGAAAKQRLRDHYDKGKLDAAYRDLYAEAGALPSAETAKGEAA